MTTGEILSLVFSAGGAAILGALLQGLRDARAGFSRARRQHIEDLAQWRDELAAKVRELQELLDYYQDQAATFERQLRLSGIEPVILPKPPALLADTDDPAER